MPSRYLVEERQMTFDRKFLQSNNSILFTMTGLFMMHNKRIALRAKHGISHVHILTVV